MGHGPSCSARDSAKDRVKTVLETITRCNVALTKYGAVNYANPDGTPRTAAKSGTWDYGQFSYFPPEALMLAMTYMYNGQPEFGANWPRVWHNLVCLQGYTWDLPNIMPATWTPASGLWQRLLPGYDVVVAARGARWTRCECPTKPGGLVARMIAAATGNK